MLSLCFKLKFRLYLTDCTIRGTIFMYEEFSVRGNVLKYYISVTSFNAFLTGCAVQSLQLLCPVTCYHLELSVSRCFSTYNIDTFGSNLPNTTIIWLPCLACTWIRCTNYCKFGQLTLWDPLAIHEAVTIAICDLVFQEE